MTHNPEMTRGYGRQFLDAADRKQILEVLDSSFLTQGPKVPAFEDALCKITGAAYAVAVSSGTAGLHLACLAAGLAPSKTAVTQDISFVASANAALYCGGSVALADIDPDSISLTPEAVQNTGAEPDLVIPVHFAGLSVLGHSFKSAGIAVIEDACHALGGSDPDGLPVGACNQSDMAVFSFHPVKSITTGEGGAITTNDSNLAEKLRELRSHGTVRDAQRWQDQAAGLDDGAANPWYYEQQTLGFNYRMTELQAALGLSQLAKLPGFIAKRRDLARVYLEQLSPYSWAQPLAREETITRSANHLFVVLLDFNRIGKSRRVVMDELRSRDVGTQVHYIPIHRHPYHQAGIHTGAYPNAEVYYEKCLTLPLHPGMSPDDVAHVTSSLVAVCIGDGI